jgi:uncharacterized protein (TIGR03118 family)
MLALIRKMLGNRSPRPQLHRYPRLEILEDRTVPSTIPMNVLQTNLVSDLPGVAAHTDPNLVNPWGISESTMSPFWISDNNAGVSTLYNSLGVPQPAAKPLIVSIPTTGDPLGSSGTPTGTVFNIDTSSTDFVLKNGTTSGRAIFLFATEDGTIVGWNPGVNPPGATAANKGTFGTIAVPNTTGAVYKGLTIATDGSGHTLLYAADFHNGRIDVFGPDFKPVTTLPMGAFTDTSLPAGYAPFNVQELGGKIYVTYAKQDATGTNNVAGPGRGFVDVFNLDGSGGTRLITRGELNSPWGIAIAPAGFGSLGGDLLVGNFGDGHINVYTPKGVFLGQLKDPDGEPIVIPGLWALKFGNGTAAGGDANTLYFTAGLDHENHGLFGSLSAVAAGTPEGQAEAQAVTAALDVFELNLQTFVNDVKTGAPDATTDQAFRDLRTSFIELVRADRIFVHDLRADGTHTADPDAALDTALHDLIQALQSL